LQSFGEGVNVDKYESVEIKDRLKLAAAWVSDMMRKINLTLHFQYKKFL
jgi:hypothetical protein